MIIKIIKKKQKLGYYGINKNQGKITFSTFFGVISKLIKLEKRIAKKC